jgi:hypothetical protein
MSTLKASLFISKKTDRAIPTKSANIGRTAPVITAVIMDSKNQHSSGALNFHSLPTIAAQLG